MNNDLDALLAAQAGGGNGDPLDAQLAARAAPAQAASTPQQPSTPIRYLAPPTFAESHIAPLLESIFGANPQGSLAGRAIQGAADPMIGLTQMAANATKFGGAANQRVADLERQYQQQRAMAGSTGFDPARLAGNFSTALLAPGGAAAPSAGLLANIFKGSVIGAGLNLAQPVTNAASGYWGEKGIQGLEGAAFGAAGVPVSSGLAAVIRPNTSDAARKLMAEGINLTPGQILGGGFQRTEDAATSIPVLGDFIRDAKNRTLTDFNQATYGRALNPVNPIRASLGLPPVNPRSLAAGPDGVLGVQNALVETYDTLLPKLRFNVQSVAPDLTNLRSMVANGLPAQESAQFNNILDRNLGQLRDGVADGQTFKDITGNLKTEASNFSGSTDGYQRQLGAALTQAQEAFDKGLRLSNPDHAAALNAIDTGWANFSRIRNAAQSAGDKSHGYTPSQLSSAVRAGDSTVGNGATGTGRALMQDLSNPARAVLPSTVSDSGTPLRHAVTAMMGGLVGHQMLPEAMSALMVPAAATVGGLALPYTQVGQKVMQKILAERPEYAGSIAALLRRSGGLLGAASAPAFAQGLLSQPQ